MPKIPEKLIEAGATGHLVILVGAGASLGAGLPSWPELLKSLFDRARSEPTAPEKAEELGKAADWFEKDTNLLLKASYLRKKMGAGWLSGAVGAAFSGKAMPTPTHQALAHIPGAAFITTNYDDLLEQAIQQRTGNLPKIVLLSDIERVGAFGAGEVFKLHGDRSFPETIVLTAEDFFAVNHQAASAWKVKIQQVLQPPYQMLFVGYGYGDIDFQQVNDSLRGAYRDRLKGPFWLQKRSPETETLADANNLRPIWLSDFSRELVPWLEALATEIDRHTARTPVMLKATAYVQENDRHFKDAQAHAQKFFDNYDFESALGVYNSLLEEAEKLRGCDPERPELRRRVASCRINVGLCLANLQKRTEARGLLLRVAKEALKDLPARGVAVLAGGLAVLGELQQARSLMSEIQPADEKDPRVCETRQLLDIFSGDVPDREPESLIARLELLNQLAGQGRLADAARRACSFLAENTKEPIGTVNALQVLHRALWGSVWEAAEAQWIPIDERGATIQAIEQGLARLEDTNELPEMSRLTTEQIKAHFFTLTQDPERRDKAQKALNQWDGSLWRVTAEEDLATNGAEKLAGGGNLEEALLALPRSGHPWADDFKRMNLAAAARRFDRALGEALRLAQQWPGREPIEYVTASLLLRASRAEEALPHARAAFRALPGYGARVLLAKCLLQTDHYEEAQSLLEPLAAKPDVEIHRLRAHVAEHLDQNNALQLWESYLRDWRPDWTQSDEIELRIVGLLFRLGRHDEAANRAWLLFEKGRDRLDVQRLIVCAQTIRLARVVDEGGRNTRLRELLETVKARFPGNSEAEGFRLSLRGAIELADEDRTIDVQRLVELNVLTPIAFDDLKEMMRRRADLLANAHAGYASGLLSFESVCELAQTELTALFLQFAHADGTGLTLSPPPRFGASPSVMTLTGQRLLVGHLELLLLQHLKLLGKLRLALGESGRLIVFSDISERIGREAANLELQTQRATLSNLERAFHILKLPKVAAQRPAIEVVDVTWAKEQGIPLLDAGSYGADHENLSPRALVNLLFQKGSIDRELANRLLQSLPPEPEPLRRLPSPLPARAAVSFPILWPFFEAGAIDALSAAFSEELVICPAAKVQLQQMRTSLEDRARAADLALALHRSLGAGIAEGRIALATRPGGVEIGLPSLRHFENEEVAERYLRQPLITALSFRRQLEKDEGLLLLTADYFQTAALGTNRASVSSLAWPSAGDFARLAERMQRAAERSIHFPELVRLLLPAAELRRSLEDLATLGFVDALTADDLIALASRFGGIDKGRPARLLDRMEWMARKAGHWGAPLAHLCLAGNYGHAIWRSFLQAFPTKSPDDVHENELACLSYDEAAASGSEAKALATTLLERAERIDQEATTDLLEVTLSNLARLAADNFKSSLVENPAAGLFTLSAETAPGRMWAYLGSWAGRDGRRRAALERAVRTALLDVDEWVANGIAKHTRSIALLLSVGVERRRFLKSPVDESFAILSATWDIPEKEDESESALRRWAGRLGEREAIASLDEAHFVYVDEKNQAPYEVIAPEAILLRAGETDASKALAETLARLQGPHDGRAYHLLMALAERPKDPELRTRYARMTVVAPWRLVREDPMVLRTWAWRRRLGWRAFPGNLADLCALLSEPYPLQLENGGIFKVLHDRICDEGSWATRRDARALAQQACEIPGLLSTFLISTRIAEEDDDAYQKDVVNALQRLSEPDDLPAGRLAGELVFLRAAAGRRPYVRLPEREVDLREELPSRFVAVLRSAMRRVGGGTRAQGQTTVATAEPSLVPESAAARASRMSLAMAEASILRLCAGVVRSLADPLRIPAPQELWLTYRLFQWLWAQLETLPRSGREERLAAMHQASPPMEPKPGETDDLLDPAHFGPERFDHRLATVLHALSLMEEIPPMLPNGNDAKAEVKLAPRSVSSPELEELLGEMAARSISAEERALRGRGDTLSVLEWRGPGIVPDLALTALLELNNEAFFRLPAEARRRWILDLPEGEQSQGRVNSKLALLLTLTLTRFARKLSPEERIVFEERLGKLEIRGEGAAYRLLGYTALLGVGQRHLAPEVERLLLENLDHLVAPESFGNYLTALSFVAPDRLEEEAERVFERLKANGIDPLPFASGVGRVIMVGKPESAPVARALLLRLAEGPPFKGSDRMQELFGVVGMLERKAP